MIILDTETTDLIKPNAIDINRQPYLVEIYCAKLNKNFEFIDEFESFVKPPIPIPEESFKVHGISDEMVATEPTFIGIYKELCQFFLGETILVAHNATFDVGVLSYELIRYGNEYKFPWPTRHVCTVEASMHIKNKRLKLRDLHELATGRKHLEGAHRAKEDVFALIRCLNWLVKEEGLEL